MKWLEQLRSFYYTQNFNIGLTVQWMEDKYITPFSSVSTHDGLFSCHEHFFTVTELDLPVDGLNLFFALHLVSLLLLARGIY